MCFMKKFLFLFLLISPFLVKSQIPTYKTSFTLEVGMPPAISNEAFKGVVKPIVCLSPYLQRKVKGDFSIGFGGHFTYWQVNPFKVPISEPAKGGINSFGLFIKPSFEKFYSDVFGVDFGVKIGYSETYFNTDINTDVLGEAQKVQALHIAPTFGFVFTSEEGNSYRFVFGYNIQGFGYHPNRIGVQTISDYDITKFSNPTSYLVVGFGYTHYFKK